MAHIKDFRDILDNLALVDIKPDRGWFTWVNNRGGDSVVRQTQSDHDAILFDLCGRKPNCRPIDNRLCFRYEDCWVMERDVKSSINNAWMKDVSNIGDKLDRKLKESQCKFDYLYVRGEKYWAQRSRAQWLKDGDRNTKYFHAKAIGHLKKNSIEKLKDGNENWVTNSKDICSVAKYYFWNLFWFNGNGITHQDMSYISECITRENNEWLMRESTEYEVLQAIK
ncbi:hypothetical protein GOBAR_DD03571 [Gossypium barbadense]|nr:hypothetical protein GOBAR_DD03571 [Gossypium barbadense]